MFGPHGRVAAPSEAGGDGGSGGIGYVGDGIDQTGRERGNRDGWRRGAHCRPF